MLGSTTDPERATETPLALNCSKVSDLLEDAEPPDTAVEEVASKLAGVSETAEARVCDFCFSQCEAGTKASLGSLHL